MELGKRLLFLLLCFFLLIVKINSGLMKALRSRRKKGLGAPSSPVAAGNAPLGGTAGERERAENPIVSYGRM